MTAARVTEPSRELPTIASSYPREVALDAHSDLDRSSLARCHLNNGLVWGFDILPSGQVEPITELPLGRGASAGFRWVHFGAAERGTTRWLDAAGLPKAVHDLLVSPDDHPCALVDGDFAAGVLQDFQRDFDDDGLYDVGALRFAVGPDLMITARKHPLRSADVIRHRIGERGSPADGAAALDLLLSAIAEVSGGVMHEMEAKAEQLEDELLADSLSPDTSQLVAMRRRAVQLHRMLTGLGASCRRLESDDALPPKMLPVVEKFAQRITGLDHQVSALQSQLRLLRDELDLQAAQRTNRSLYVLSILSALMLPATFVTGLFGMNTGGLPFAQSSVGTLIATFLAICSAAAVYLVLKVMGFVRF